MPNVELKEDYRIEFIRLIREQYKESPYFSSVLENKGKLAQIIENSLFEINDLNKNFGILDGLSRDALNRTGEMFGVLAPQLLSSEDLISEIKCFVIKAFSRTTINDFEAVSKFVYQYDSDVIDLDNGIYLNVYGDISSNNAKRGKLLYRCIRSMMPIYTNLYGIIETNYGYFGFSEFKPIENGGWREPNSLPLPEKRMAKLVIDKNGMVV